MVLFRFLLLLFHFILGWDGVGLWLLLEDMRPSAQAFSQLCLACFPCFNLVFYLFSNSLSFPAFKRVDPATFCRSFAYARLFLPRHGIIYSPLVHWDRFWRDANWLSSVLSASPPLVWATAHVARLNFSSSTKQALQGCSTNEQLRLSHTLFLVPTF